MMSRRGSKRPPPSEAARLAAVAKRREIAAVPKDKARVEVFVVRREAAGRSFGWEIRRFGSVVVERSAAAFASVEHATVAGEAALALHPKGA